MPGSVGHTTDAVSLPAGSGGDYTVTFDVASTTIKSLTIDATLALPANKTLTVSSAYTQGSDGTLSMTDSDQLAVGSTASLAGTLNITSASSSSLGSSTRLLTFPSVSGNFTTINLPTAPSNSALHTYEAPNRFQLLATSTDATVFWVDDTPNGTSPTEWFDTTNAGYWSNTSGASVSSPASTDKVFIGNFAGSLGVVYDTSVETFSSSTVASVTSLVPITIENGTLEDTGDFSVMSSVSGATALTLAGGVLQLHQGNVTTSTTGSSAWGIVVQGGELKNAVVPSSDTIKGTTLRMGRSRNDDHDRRHAQSRSAGRNDADRGRCPYLRAPGAGCFLGVERVRHRLRQRFKFTTEVTSSSTISLNGTVILGDSPNNEIDIVGTNLSSSLQRRQFARWHWSYWA